MCVNKTLYTCKWLAIGLFLSTCTSSKWSVESTQSIDRTEFNLVDEDIFLEISQKPDPNMPILVYDVWNVKTYDYSIKIQTNRYLQRYRPSLTAIFFGVLGASAGYLTAGILSLKEF